MLRARPAGFLKPGRSARTPPHPLNEKAIRSARATKENLFISASPFRFSVLGYFAFRVSEREEIFRAHVTIKRYTNRKNRNDAPKMASAVINTANPKLLRNQTSSMTPALLHVKKHGRGRFFEKIASLPRKYIISNITKMSNPRFCDKNGDYYLYAMAISNISILSNVRREETQPYSGVTLRSFSTREYSWFSTEIPCPVVPTGGARSARLQEV